MSQISFFQETVVYFWIFLRPFSRNGLTCTVMPLPEAIFVMYPRFLKSFESSTAIENLQNYIYVHIQWSPQYCSNTFADKYAWMSHIKTFLTHFNPVNSHKSTHVTLHDISIPWCSEQIRCLTSRRPIMDFQRQLASMLRQKVKKNWSFSLSPIFKNNNMLVFGV